MGKCYFERSQIPKLYVKHLQREHLEFYARGSSCTLGRKSGPFPRPRRVYRRVRQAHPTSSPHLQDEGARGRWGALGGSWDHGSHQL